MIRGKVRTRKTYPEIEQIDGLCASVQFVIYEQDVNKDLTTLRQMDYGAGCSQTYLGLICSDIHRTFSIVKKFDELYECLHAADFRMMSEENWNLLIANGFTPGVVHKGIGFEGGFAWRFLRNLERACHLASTGGSQ